MRAVHLSDLHVAACAVRGLPSEDQIKQIGQALDAAAAADLYRKRFRKAHPAYGSGTLSAAIGTVIEPDRCDRDYLRAMHAVVTVLLRRAGEM